jgi:hypothetical protein
VNGGLIEHFDFAGGMPGRSYRVRVGYAQGLDGKMVYVDHNLNQTDGDEALAVSIGSQGNRHAIRNPDQPEVDQGPGPQE